MFLVLLVRMIFERYLLLIKYGGENLFRSYVIKLMKDNMFINDLMLVLEIYECLVSDDYYGLYVDNIK